MDFAVCGFLVLAIPHSLRFHIIYLNEFCSCCGIFREMLVGGQTGN